MKLISILFIVSIASISIAKKAETGAHREHGAHAHGAGNLGIAFEGPKGRIDLKIPSESIIGFEYVAKTAKAISQRDSAIESLEKNIGSLIVFDGSLNCKITKDKIEIKAESEKHSDLLAGFNVVCAKSPVGTEIVFNFQSRFPKIKDLDVDAIADNVQKSVEAINNNTRLLLK